VNRFLVIAWVLVILGLAAVVGQSLGLYDVPLLREVRLPLPAVFQRQASPAGGPTPATAASPAPVASAGVAATVRPAVGAGATAVTTDLCSPGAPHFVHGAADLKALLGDDMGMPLECERVIDAAGNTEQQTTTGLVYYRAGPNVTVFTTGQEHWALTPAGVVRWSGDAVEPPPSDD
jgi:hypothetical protein